LSQDIVPNSPTLALSVETINENQSKTVNAQYDNATAQWRTDVSVLPGASTEFILSWTTKVDDQSLVLAQAQKVVAVPIDADQLDLNISSDEYNLSFDADADGISNLTEQMESTNPFDSSDPGTPLVLVDVVVQLDIPTDLVDSDDAATIVPSALLNGKALDLSFNGTTWEGSATAVENSDVFLTASFGTDAIPGIDLANVQRSKNVKSGESIIIKATDYFTAIDTDADGFTNINEFNNNTDPANANDPAKNPCDISQFEVGCDIDTDNDGKPDSVEGANTDTDMDGRFDYQESSTADSDNDGISDELDPIENDQCAPTGSDPACPIDTDSDGVSDATDNCPKTPNPDQTDTDNNGVGDACEILTIDTDNDGVIDSLDNCPNIANADQLDTNNNGIGDACETVATDTDGDGVADANDNCINIANADQLDTDNDGIGDACELVI